MSGRPVPTVEDRVRDACRSEGFASVCFAPCTPLHAARDAAESARGAGRLEGMAWMTGEWLDRATDPQRFLPGARSVILVALTYHGEDPPLGLAVARGGVARYARGRDYHRVFESRLRRLTRVLKEEFSAESRATVDYGPLLERPLAAAAGMGWLGKSTMLLVPGTGPWVLLGAVATTLELTPDAPLAKSCGNCTRCVVACPTGALGAEGGILDARLCISYHTIENRGPIPRALRAKFGDWVFGCDACLDSCPVGAANHDIDAEFVPADAEDANPALGELIRLDEEEFRTRFQGRAIMRAKRDGLVRNACVALGNVGAAADFDILRSALADTSPLVRGHAAWGLATIAERHHMEDLARAALETSLQSEHDATAREELTLALAELSPRDSSSGTGVSRGDRR